MPVDKIGLIVVSCFVDETKTVGGGAAQAVLHSVDAIMCYIWSCVLEMFMSSLFKAISRNPL